MNEYNGDDLETTISSLRENAHQLQQRADKLQKQVEWMESSIFWKIRNTYMKAKSVRKEDLRSLTRKATHILRAKGPVETARFAYQYARYGKKSFRPKEITISEYAKWITKHEVYDRAVVNTEIAEMAKKPKISVVVPVYNVDPKWLNACIQSVVDQWYENWELCLHDDASTNPKTVKALRAWEGKDERIKISYSSVNEHICGSTNTALQLATGEYITLLDCDDAITPFALFEFARAINKDPQAEFFYSDEDKIDMNNVRLNPFFKPDWSPELLRALNYITHMVCMTRELGDKIGWFREGYEGAQDYDLILRATGAATGPIIHIPKILYHWRMTDTSTATDVSNKQYAHSAGEQALRDLLESKGIEYDSVTEGFGITNYHVKYAIAGESPLVSVIIPFKDKPDLLKQCVDSILSRTSYVNFELLLVSNNSTDPKMYKLLERYKKHKRIRVLEHNVPFNYSEINNWAARQANGEYLLFLNNDTKVINSEWMVEMVRLASQSDVGAVGAQLFYPNKTLQHAGVILGMTGLAGHIFARQKPDTTYYRLSEFPREYLAVTAACLMIDKEKFWEVGGLNEEFTVCGNDVNLGLDLHEKGYRNIYTPYARLFHYESMTRDKMPPAGDFAVSEKRYAPYLNWNDPYFNPNLSLIDESIQLRTDQEYA